MNGTVDGEEVHIETRYRDILSFHLSVCAARGAADRSACVRAALARAWSSPLMRVRTLGLPTIQLKQTLPKSSLPPFPSKKLFGNMDDKFVEERRQQLEDYFAAYVLLRRTVCGALAPCVCRWPSVLLPRSPSSFVKRHQPSLVSHDGGGGQVDRPIVVWW